MYSTIFSHDTITKIVIHNTIFSHDELFENEKKNSVSKIVFDKKIISCGVTVNFFFNMKN